LSAESIRFERSESAIREGEGPQNRRSWIFYFIDTAQLILRIRGGNMMDVIVWLVWIPASLILLVLLVNSLLLT